MTVAELIEELKKMPQDLVVVSMYEHVDSVRLIHDYYDGDSCNPDCPIIDAVEIM